MWGFHFCIFEKSHFDRHFVFNDGGFSNSYNVALNGGFGFSIQKSYRSNSRT